MKQRDGAQPRKGTKSTRERLRGRRFLRYFAHLVHFLRQMFGGLFPFSATCWRNVRNTKWIIPANDPRALSPKTRLLRRWFRRRGCAAVRVLVCVALLFLQDIFRVLFALLDSLGAFAGVFQSFSYAIIIGIYIQGFLKRS